MTRSYPSTHVTKRFINTAAAPWNAFHSGGAIFCQCTVVFSLTVGALCRGDEIQWSGLVDHDFSNPNNWVGGRIPGPIDSAVIGEADLGQHRPIIRQEDSVVVERIEIGTFDGQRASRELNIDGGHVEVGEIVLQSDQQGESATLAIGSGSVNAERLTLLGLGAGNVQLSLGGGSVNIGAGGINTGSPGVGGMIIILEAGLIDGTAAGADLFAGVHDDLTLLFTSGVLRVDGRVEDIGQVSPHIRATATFCASSILVRHWYWEELDATDIFAAPPGGPPGSLQAGDADRNGVFDQLDLVQVHQAGKYLTGRSATWGEGDWDAAPGGSRDNPPRGDGEFNQVDIIASLKTSLYLQGCDFAANRTSERAMGSGNASVVHDVGNGADVGDAPVDTRLTLIDINPSVDSFTADAAQNLGVTFDNDPGTNIFKPTFGSSFASRNVARAGVLTELVLDDFAVASSLQPVGRLSDVDQTYIPVPEPSATVLVLLAVCFTCLGLRRTSTNTFQIRVIAVVPTQ